MQDIGLVLFVLLVVGSCLVGLHPLSCLYSKCVVKTVSKSIDLDLPSAYVLLSIITAVMVEICTFFIR